MCCLDQKRFGPRLVKNKKNMIENLLVNLVVLTMFCLVLYIKLFLRSNSIRHQDRVRTETRQSLNVFFRPGFAVLVRKFISDVKVFLTVNYILKVCIR